MSKYVIIQPDGTTTKQEAKKLDLHELYKIIGTDCVSRTEVRYEGKKRYVWLSDNGFAEGKEHNPHIRPLAEAYWKRPCQDFVGVGVVWIP